MQSALKTPAPGAPAPAPSLRDIDEPVDLARFVRAARTDPRAAASVLAHYLDCQRVHHDGSDLARTLDTWATTLTTTA